MRRNSSNDCGDRLAEGLIVGARELRPEGGALHQVLPCGTVLALSGCRKTYVPHAYTGRLHSSLANLAPIGIFHVNIRAARCSLLPRSTGWPFLGRFSSTAGSRIGRGEEEEAGELRGI